MKKNIKKIGKQAAVAALALALILGGVTGCGTTSSNATTQGPDGHQPPDGEAPGEPPDGEPPEGGPGGQGGPGNDASSVSWSGATEVSDSETYTGTNYESSTEDENALLVSGDVSPTFDNITVTKSGSGSSGDNQSFYGTNSAVMVKDGADVTIKNATITTDSDGANGVFSYGGSATTGNTSSDGTTVNISDSTITTTGNGSGGIMTTGGGTTNASNLTVTTSGNSSAAIRTDRGGGTVTVDGGTYTTNGTGSPTIYSTADVTVSNATLVSNSSEGVCIEGTNSITLNNCNLTASNSSKNGNATYNDTIMIYQSMSGDAAGTNSTFTMTGGTLNSKVGHVFHVTNTTAEINLSNVTINNSDSDNILLSVTNDGWSGAANTATVNATSQKLEGRIIVSNTASADSQESTLNLNIDTNSTFTGSIGDENSSSDALGTVNVSLDGTWTLTGDSYVTSISGNGNINYNGYTLYVDGTTYTSGMPS